MKLIDSFSGNNNFLSNFFHAPVKIHGEDYRTNEHWYQAMKAYAPEYRARIRNIYSPGAAKKEGRNVMMHPDFEANKDAIMVRGLVAKFAQYPYLFQMLEKTGEAIIVEGNKWHDNYWGNCNCPKCEAVEGLNKLGNSLMVLRDGGYDNIVFLDNNMNIGDQWR